MNNSTDLFLKDSDELTMMALCGWYFTAAQELMNPPFSSVVRVAEYRRFTQPLTVAWNTCCHCHLQQVRNGAIIMPDATSKTGALSSNRHVWSVQ